MILPIISATDFYWNSWQCWQIRDSLDWHSQHFMIIINTNMNTITIMIMIERVILFFVIEFKLFRLMRIFLWVFVFLD